MPVYSAILDVIATTMWHNHTDFITVLHVFVLVADHPIREYMSLLVAYSTD
jgi:hypothetical protein